MLQVLRCTNKGFYPFPSKITSSYAKLETKTKTPPLKDRKKPNCHLAVFLSLAILFPTQGRVSLTPSLLQLSPVPLCTEISCFDSIAE